MPNPKAVYTGQAIIERNGDEFLVLFPDGSVRPFGTYAEAFKSISVAFAKRTPTDAIGVGEVTSYDGSIETKGA